MNPVINTISKAYTVDAVIWPKFKQSDEERQAYKSLNAFTLVKGVFLVSKYCKKKYWS